MSSKKNLDENDNIIMPENEVEPAAKKIKLFSRSKTESFTINQLKQTQAGQSSRDRSNQSRSTKSTQRISSKPNQTPSKPIKPNQRNQPYQI